MKKCTKCLKDKDFNEFYKSKRGKNGLAAYCKKCADMLNKIRYGHLLKTKYQKSPQSKEKQQKYLLKTKYNMTLSDYNNLFSSQNGCCAICGRHQSEFKKALAIDHNHINNKIRGLLCCKCNTGLGMFKADESIDFLLKAIEYIKNTNN